MSRRAVAEYLIPPLWIDAGRALRNLHRARADRRVIEANAAWKSRHPGGRVFVIGNGPSLSDFDRDWLRGEKLIVMNGFDRAPWKDEVDIVAHCIAEPRSSPAWNAAEIRASINGTRSASYWLDLSSYRQLSGVEAGKSLHHVLPVYEPGLWRGRTFDLAAPTLAYQTTAQLAIQVAAHMGFAEILLIGFDHDWLASRDYSRHFYSMRKDTTDSIGQMPYLEIIGFMRRMWLIYAAMQQTAERAGIRIVNLSSRTVLDVFDRQDAAVHLGPPRSGATALRAAATPVISPTAVPN
jgi:hypothetical protein